jgi:preprotein translocase subunit SecG
MADQYPPPGYGGQQPPSYPGGPGDAGGYGGPPGYGGQPPGYGGYGSGYGGFPGPQNPQSSTPTVLSVIGIVCWFLCSPAAIVLGIIAQSQFRNQGRPDTLAKTAWIGGIVVLVIGIVVAIATSRHASRL